MASLGDVMSAVPRRVPSASAGTPLAAAIDRFGGDLVTRLAATVGGNIILSPYSVALALAMTRAGAATGTRDQLDRVLHLESLDADEGFNTLERALATRDSESIGPDGKGRSVTLATANALWPQAGYPIASAFLDLLASHYGAGVHLVDYLHDTERSRRTINAWVSDRTAEKIPELIPSGALTMLTRLVLTNAVYFKAAWAEPFETSATSQGDFTRLDGSVVSAPFMHTTKSVGWAQGEGWQAVELPYVGGTLALDVIVPDPGRFAAIASALGNGTGSFVEHLERHAVQLALPKFRCRTQTSLVSTLEALGVTDLFDPDRADLSAMTTAENLYVSDVVHEAFIEVDEAGTEAAATTAVIAVTRSAPITPLPLRVDRPFILALRDLETNSLLFLGCLLDPTE